MLKEKNNFFNTLNYFNKENIVKNETLNIINNTYKKIEDFLNDIDNKIFNVLEEHEKEFLFQYKNQMIIVKNEINRLKTKIDENKIKNDNEKKLKILFEERNFFRAQSLKLFEDNKILNKKYEELKVLFSNLKQDKLFFENFLIEVKKENDQLKIENQENYNNIINNLKNIKDDSIINVNEKTIEKTKLNEKDITNSTNKYTKENDNKYKNMINELTKNNKILKKKLEKEKSNNFEKYKINLNHKQLLIDSIEEIKKDNNYESYLNFNKNDKKNLIYLLVENEFIKHKFFEFLNIDNNQVENNKTQTNKNYKIKSLKNNIVIDNKKIYFKFK